jgi:hypothetical protein
LDVTVSLHVTPSHDMWHRLVTCEAVLWHVTPSQAYDAVLWHVTPSNGIWHRLIMWRRLMVFDALSMACVTASWHVTLSYGIDTVSWHMTPSHGIWRRLVECDAVYSRKLLKIKFSAQPSASGSGCCAITSSFLHFAKTGEVAQSVWRLARGWTVRGSNPGKARFSVPVQTGPGAHPASYKKDKFSPSRGQSSPGVFLTIYSPSNAICWEWTLLFLSHRSVPAWHVTGRVLAAYISLQFKHELRTDV